MSVQQILVVLAGSALGGLLRWMSSFLFPQNLSFYSTLFVNLLGCFLIGLCFALSQKHQWNSLVSLFVIIGLLGGFTTFSSFGLDIMKMIQAGQVNQAVFYGLLSVIGGLVAFFMGWKVV